MTIFNSIKEAIDYFQVIKGSDEKLVEHCTKIAEAIKAENYTVLNLIEELGPLLTSQEHDERKQGVWILNNVLKVLPTDFLNEIQTDFISKFYIDRLRDHHEVLPQVLIGITVLIKLKHFPTNAVVGILNGLFQNVGCQQQQALDRYNIYNIFESFLYNNKEDVVAMGIDFVYGVISSVDGERDPRNLAYLFSWMPTLVKTVKLDHLNEEMFEIMACYFPIDYKAPPQNPDAISREILAEKLGNCLSAIPDFAEPCLTLALEKLDSSLKISKMDSLDLIGKGCNTFPTKNYQQHSREIFTQLQKDIMTNSDEEIIEKSLNTLTIVVSKLSDLPKEDLTTILKDITDTVKGNLLPGGRLFQKSCQILENISRASKESSYFITWEIVNLLSNTYTMLGEDKVEDKKMYLTALTGFHKVYFKLNETPQMEIKQIVCYIPIMCVQNLSDCTEDLTLISLNCLIRMMPNISFDIRQVLFEYLLKTLTSKTSNVLRKKCLEVLENMRTFFAVETMSNYVEKYNETLNLELFLDSLCYLNGNTFNDRTLKIILSKILSEKNEEVFIGVKTFEKLLLKQKDNTNFRASVNEFKALELFLEKLYKNNISLNEEFLQSASNVLKLIVNFQDKASQSETLQKNVSKIVSLASTNSSFVVILSAVLVSVEKNVVIDYSVLDILIDHSHNCTNHFVNEAAFQAVANLINKCPEEVVVESYLNKIVNICNPKNTSEKITNLLIWTTKALVYRNHKKAPLFSDKILEFLDLSLHVENAFEIILDDSYQCLSSDFHCNKTLLYKQKCFTYVVDKLTATVSKEKTIALATFANMLKHTPKSVILLNFKKILKLLVLTMDNCEEPDILLLILSTLNHFIENKESIIEDYVQEFLPRFLKLATFEKSMKIRIEALKCIQNYTTGFTLYKLLPFKQDVLIGLGKCIDDKKRFVRKQAMETRSLWYLLDAPL